MAYKPWIVWRRLQWQIHDDIVNTAVDLDLRIDKEYVLNTNNNDIPVSIECINGWYEYKKYNDVQNNTTKLKFKKY